MAAVQSSVEVPANPPSLKDQLNETDGGRQRFLLELEFVHCLANPTYIHYLAQNRYFEDDAFVGYLKYLQYWQRPDYTKFIVYPHALFFLELLQSPHFRSAMAHPSNKELAHRQQFYYWKHYRNNRLKHILPRPLPEEAPPQPPQILPPAAPPVPAPVKTENNTRGSTVFLHILGLNREISTSLVMRSAIWHSEPLFFGCLVFPIMPLIAL